MAEATPPSLRSGVTAGILLMLLAYACFSVVDTSTKWLVTAGIPAMQAAFFRYAVHLGLCFTDRDSVRQLHTAKPYLGQLVVRALFLVTATMVNFVALFFLPLSTTAAIMFASPIIVCLLSGPMLGDRVGPWRWGAILFGFVGVLVIIRPFGDGFSWAALMMLYPASALALYSIQTRQLVGKVDGGVMQLILGLVGTGLLAPLAWWFWVAPDSVLDWLLLPLLGLSAWVGHGFLIRAHAFATSSVLMPFTYSFLIYLSISGYLVFGDVPDATTLMGATMIVISGLVIWARERYRADADLPQTPKTPPH
ncbi:MAG: DMT family transporter [Pseudomonadota bacterium]